MSSILKALKKLEENPEARGEDLSILIPGNSRPPRREKKLLKWLGILAVLLTGAAAALYLFTAGSDDVKPLIVKEIKALEMPVQDNIQVTEKDLSKPALPTPDFPRKQKTALNFPQKKQWDFPKKDPVPPEAEDKKTVMQKPVKEEAAQPEKPAKEIKPETPAIAKAEKPVITKPEKPAGKKQQMEDLQLETLPREYEVSLQAISWNPSPEKRIAVINNQVLREGSANSEIAVLRIEKNHVVVSIKGQEWMLKHKFTH